MKRSSKICLRSIIFISAAAVAAATAAGLASSWAAAGPSPATRAAGRPPDLGVNASLNGRGLLPQADLWNKDVSQDPVDPNSEGLIASIGRDKPLHPDFGRTYGIPYVVVDGDKTPRVKVQFEYADESDPGPYPIPANPPIEGGADSTGDRHVLVLDRQAWKLYELYSSYPQDGGKWWKAGSGAIFDLRTGKARPAGWTSADAAGLPILPGLVRYDEVAAGDITHAVRFTVQRTRRAYVAPASHFASRSDDAGLPPMGMRVRLKAAYDIGSFPPHVQVVLKAFKKYGLILADNGSDWFVSGSPHPQWDDDEALGTLKKVKGRDLEVVKMSELVTK